MIYQAARHPTPIKIEDPGNLDQLRGQAGGHHRDRIRSFELYRRQLREPEIVTFDELLARAEWHITTAENEAGDKDGA